jgi:hypothetical protein
MEAGAVETIVYRELALADAAQAKRHNACTIVRGDFVVEPARLLCGADVVVFSGSLNTLEPADFYRTLRVAYDAAGQAVLFNFLCAASLAASEYLNWYRRADVLSFARSLAADVRLLDDYLSGDCTVAIRRSGAERPARRTEAQRQEEGT